MGFKVKTFLFKGVLQFFILRVAKHRHRCSTGRLSTILRDFQNSTGQDPVKFVISLEFNYRACRSHFQPIF